jgi:hypothetical protein
MFSFLLDSPKIPAASATLSPPRNHFSAVNDPTGSLPSDKMISELALAEPETGEFLGEAS